jgi:hypothetical protein
MDKQINNVLAEWNPLEVPTDVARVEYQEYIPHIKQKLHDESALLSYLEHIVTDDMGLSYDHHNEEHLKDIQNVCHRLMEIC